MEITFEPKQKYILVHANGEMDLKTAKELFIKLLCFCTDQVNVRRKRSHLLWN